MVTQILSSRESELLMNKFQEEYEEEKLIVEELIKLKEKPKQTLIGMIEGSQAIENFEIFKHLYRKHFALQRLALKFRLTSE